MSAIQSHQAYLQFSGEGKKKTLISLEKEITEILIEKLHEKLQASLKTTESQQILSQALEKKIDPYKAANLIYPL